MKNITIYFTALLFALILVSPNCKAKAQIDTVEVFLEDTGYYYYKGPLELIGYIDSLKQRNKNSNLGSVIFYFNSFGGCQYFFKDSLADGYYKIYDLSKKNKKKDKNAYLVAEGLFINRLRQGAFKYQDVGGNILKVVPFENDIVQGKVFEYFHQRIEYIVEYNQGIIDGFYFHRDRHSDTITINYYRKGKLVDYEIIQY